MDEFNNMNYDNNQQDGEFYSDPNNQFYDIRKPMWAAITSFVLSIVNVISCCCCGYIAIIGSLVLGIISLAKKWGGKGFAVAGITISSICLVVTIGMQVFLGGLTSCINDVINTAPQYYEEYKETGEIPEELEKYNNDEYDWYWNLMGNDSFVEFYDQFMKIYGLMADESVTTENHINEDDFFDYNEFDSKVEEIEPEFGETPVDL